jgi:hypothetical protein
MQARVDAHVGNCRVWPQLHADIYRFGGYKEVFIFFGGDGQMCSLKAGETLLRYQLGTPRLALDGVYSDYS